MMFQAID